MYIYTVKSTLFLIFITVFGISQAQFQDNFSDGDFTANPTWIGDTDSFEVNAAKQLHLNAPANTQKSYLAVASPAAVNGFWEFYVALDFNPSSGNKAYVYLMSDQSNLKGSLNGYYVLIGNTDDEVSLYRQDGSTITKIIDGVNGTVNNSNPKVKIKVTRDMFGNFELFSDTSVAFTNPISEGTIFDNTYMSSAYFGVLCDYTATRSDKFIFDDFNVTAAPYVDIFPPTLLAYEILNLNSIKLSFSEPLTVASSENTANYFINNGIGEPSTSVWSAIDNSVVLSLNSSIQAGINYTLNASVLEDLSLNTLDTSFQFKLKNAYSYNTIIFNEVLADELPSFGLPAYEFLELKNLSSDTLFTAGWSLTDLTGVCYFPADTILPNQYVIVCGNTAKPLYEAYGKTFGITSFVSLNKTEELLTLYDQYGTVIDSLRYFDKWFGKSLAPDGSLKVDGGWTLARMSDDYPCSPVGNWTPSNDIIGGSPGAANNFDATLGSVAPAFVSASFTNDSTIQIIFDQEVIGANDIANYEVSATNLDQIFIQQINTVSGSGTTYFITIDEMSNSDYSYSLILSNVQNCAGVPMVQNSTDIFIVKAPKVGDLILNEILFNPYTGGQDYIEIYNTTQQAIDLAGLKFVKYYNDYGDSIASISSALGSNFILPPNTYFTFSGEPEAVFSNYIVDKPEWLFKHNIPNYADNEGDVGLVFYDTLIIDRLHYFARWNFELLDTKDGVALERIKFDGATQDKANWASAAASFGYGTPTAKNSMAYQEMEQDDVITVSPEVFTPNQDGFEDYALINYTLDQPDYVATVAIYDIVGRKIKDLATKQTIGREGFWRWDGTNYNQEKAKTGMYVVLVNLFDLTGKKRLYKKTVVLGTTF